MLAPAALAQWVGEKPESVTRAPLATAHFSGNSLERIAARGGSYTAYFVLKHFSRTGDWVMRLTHDIQTREVALFRGGIFRRLPSVCYVPILAVAREGEDWASLMWDVRPALEAAAKPVVEPEDARLWLEHLAWLHARFRADASLADPALGLASLQDFLTILSPQVVRRELREGRTHPVLERAARGWDVFDATAPPDIRRAVQAWQHKPEPLLDALARMPQTLVHGDYKLANLGILDADAGNRRSVILDWQDATHGPGVLDFGYFLCLNAKRLPFSKEQAIAIYNEALTAAGVRIAEDDLPLGLLGGGALRLLWWLATDMPDELKWWYDVIRRVSRLGL